VASSTKAKDQVKGGLLLDVVVAKGAAILKLLSCEDQTLLIGGNALLVLDLGLDVFDGVGRFHIEGDGFTREGFYEDLHLLEPESRKEKKGEDWGQRGVLCYKVGEMKRGW